MREALAETTDQYTYLRTALDRLEAASKVDARAVEMLGLEIHQAEEKHGPLTYDLFRSLSILAEEVGEVNQAALVLKRAERGNQHADFRDLRRAVVDELVQAASVALLIAKNLNYGD